MVYTPTPHEMAADIVKLFWPKLMADPMVVLDVKFFSLGRGL